MTATATLLVVFDTATVRIEDDGRLVDVWPVTHNDGPGPVPAATTVLDRHGWTTGDWDQQSSGITGGEWTTTAAWKDAP